MRFNAAHKQDISKWTQVRMERENNMREFKAEEELPKFGAGSEFGREQKEEARRKKYGVVTKKYNPDDQPWLLRVGGKNGKKFKGIREGGVSDNTSYYVFCKAPDGVFEAFPVEEWYNFNPIGRFKALTAEEAEEEFEKRDKVMNHFSIMVRKKMEDGNQEHTQEKKSKKEKKDFKISDMDDWLSESDFEDDGDAGKEEEEEEEAKKKKVNKKKKKSDDEAVEESDEGDFDDREVDYMSASSSEEEPEDEKANRELKGVEDEDALRGIDQSDEEEEDAEKEEDKGSEDEANKPTPETKVKSKGDKKDSKPQPNSSGESTSESSDSDFDDSKFHSAMFMQKPKNSKSSDGAVSGRGKPDDKKNKSSSKAQKRKARESSPSSSPKRMRHEPSAPTASNTWSGSTEGISEDSVRRYLLRKPMTTTELLQKFKSKKTGLTSDKLVNTIAQILKKLNPIKQTIKGKLYLSIKP